MTAQTFTRETLHGVTAETHSGQRLSVCVDCRGIVERIEWANGVRDERGDAGFSDVPSDGINLHACPPRTLEKVLEDPGSFLLTALSPIHDPLLRSAVEGTIRQAFLDDDDLSRRMSEGG